MGDAEMAVCAVSFGWDDATVVTRSAPIPKTARPQPKPSQRRKRHCS